MSCMTYTSMGMEAGGSNLSGLKTKTVLYVCALFSYYRWRRALAKLDEKCCDRGYSRR